MPVFLAVALAGAVGASARYGLDLVFRRDAHHVPWVTFAINVTGSFALGLLVATFDAHPHPSVRPALTIGLLGAYTTFSTLSLEASGSSTVVTLLSPPAMRSGVSRPDSSRSHSGSRSDDASDYRVVSDATSRQRFRWRRPIAAGSSGIQRLKNR